MARRVEAGALEFIEAMSMAWRDQQGFGRPPAVLHLAIFSYLSFHISSLAGDSAGMIGFSRGCRAERADLWSSYLPAASDICLDLFSLHFQVGSKLWRLRHQKNKEIIAFTISRIFLLRWIWIGAGMRLRYILGY